MRPTLDDTIALIQRLHAGVTDYTGRAYWEHPVAVMKLLPADATDAERMAALLHDVFEDTETTAADLRALGYGDDVLDMVELVTRRPEKGTYIEWVISIANSGNRGAIRVKLADNLHNADPERIASIPDHEKRMQMEQVAERRYARSIRILSAALSAA